MTIHAAIRTLLGQEWELVGRWWGHVWCDVANALDVALQIVWNAVIVLIWKSTADLDWGSNRVRIGNVLRPKLSCWILFERMRNRTHTLMSSVRILWWRLTSSVKSLRLKAPFLMVFSRIWKTPRHEIWLWYRNVKSWYLQSWHSHARCVPLASVPKSKFIYIRHLSIKQTIDPYKCHSQADDGCKRRVECFYNHLSSLDCCLRVWHLQSWNKSQKHSPNFRSVASSWCITIHFLMCLCIGNRQLLLSDAAICHPWSFEHTMAEIVPRARY